MHFIEGEREPWFAKKACMTVDEVFKVSREVASTLVWPPSFEQPPEIYLTCE